MTSSAALYFAFGSNMSSARLTERIAGCTGLGAAAIDGYVLRCNKRGADGSGKANLAQAAGERSWGVLFRFPPDAWATLDGYEVGYDRVECTVEHATLGRVAACTYLAREPEPGAIDPFDWYLGHMRSGAREFALPDAWQRTLAAWPSRPDPRRA